MVTHHQGCTSGPGYSTSMLKRLISGDSFFLSTYKASSVPGQVVLAPTMMGQVAVIEMDGSRR